ncbi:topoisomerase C-terminal repeat-containing protein [Pseudomonas syringae group genomosp. 7]|uniref:topoisomerase C-terminal repeat-containing protein n=1 Tax=Pseudomonas syringae group genomosp. 7 TaxID=251699 RepID=UPI001F4BD6A3|nr:topoisomerase C-terminal repeat-containing protein [Pseudomonas syringae group genomosp. 7]UNB66156.1 topoisomerase C-terminal repeat-containing protein [Pseudomonas syringae pv. helianthi]
MLSPGQIEALLTNGKTGVLKGFHSKKTGKSFEAALKLNNEAKLESCSAANPSAHDLFKGGISHARGTTAQHSSGQTRANDDSASPQLRKPPRPSISSTSGVITFWRSRIATTVLRSSSCRQTAQQH